MIMHTWCQRAGAYGLQILQGPRCYEARQPWCITVEFRDTFGRVSGSRLLAFTMQPGSIRVGTRN